MNAISAHARSGLQAAQQRLAASAHNVANAATPGFQRQLVQTTTAAGGGVSVQVQRSEAVAEGLSVADAIEQIAARQAFAANLASLRSEQDTLGRLLDLTA